MDMSPTNQGLKMGAARRRGELRWGVVVAAAMLPLALAACSSSPTPTPTNTVSPTQTQSPSATDTPTPTQSESPTPTDTPTDSPSPSDSPTATDTPSPTGSSTSSPSPTGSASASPSGSVSPSPSGSVLGIGVVFTPTTAKAWEQINIVGTTVPSLAGKRPYILKINHGVNDVLDTGSPITAAGIIRTWAKLGRDGELRLIVPAVPVVAGPLPVGTALLAQSGVFMVKVG